MSDRVEIYDVTGAPAIEIVNQAGDIAIRRSDEPRVKIVLRGNAEAVAATQIDASPESISIRARHSSGRFFSKTVDVIVSAPPGGYLKVDLATGQVRVRIPLKEAVVTTASGDVRLDKTVGRASITVASGDVLVSDVTGEAEVSAASGDVRIAKAGDVVVNTASGGVRIDEAERTISIKSASGDVNVKRFGGSDLDINTMSGNATIGLIPGMEVRAKIRTLSGDFRNRIKPMECERTDSMSLRVKSFSGDVTLKTAS